MSEMITETEQAAEVDVIERVTQELDNLDRDQTLNQLRTCIENESYQDFYLGGLIYRIKQNQWWDSDIYTTFKDYVQKEFGLHYRKAAYLMQIYEGLVYSGVPFKKIAHLKWSKLKLLSGILTPKNVDKWLATADSLSVVQLQEFVRDYKRGDNTGPDSPSETQARQVSTMTLKLHDDQKETILTAIEKCKGELGTDNISVALDGICTNFLTGGDVSDQGVTETEAMETAKKVSGSLFDDGLEPVQVEQAQTEQVDETPVENGAEQETAAFDLKSEMEKVGFMDVLSTFEQLWPNIDLEVTLPKDQK